MTEKGVVDLASMTAEQPGDVLLEDYRPLMDSLDWRVAQTYWHVRGIQAFATQELPNLICSHDGIRAHRSADVFFEHCLEMDERDELELKIEVVEVAVGLGLHARFWLDRLRDRCHAEGKDYYDRVAFYATDISRKTIEGIQQQQTLAPHGSRVHFGKLDAKNPALFVEHDDGSEINLAGRVRCYLANNVLSLLPSNLLWRSKDWWGDLQIQTLLSGLERLNDVTHLTAAGIQALVARSDNDALTELTKVSPFFRIRRAFFTIDLVDLPFGREIRRFSDEILQPYVDEQLQTGADIRLPNPRGAVWSLEAMLKALRPGGYVLFRDFGPGNLERILAQAAHQRFGNTAAMGLNFPFIDYYMKNIRAEPAHIHAPSGCEDDLSHARLLSLDPLPRTHEAFVKAFDKADFDAYDAIVGDARAARAAQDTDTARRHYKKAHEMAPENGSLLAEWARLEFLVAKDVQRCAELCEKALALNPTGSAELWCEYGDALYYLGGHTAAHQAFERAIAINPESPRALFNIAWTHFERGEISEALSACGKSLAADATGLFQERILKLQEQILQRKTNKRTAEAERLKNRFAT